MIVPEHYCEMSHVDAEQALAIYRHFCKQTEHVMEYLAVVKKLQNLLNVPIPILKYVGGLLSDFIFSIDDLYHRLLCHLLVLWKSISKILTLSRTVSNTEPTKQQLMVTRLHHSNRH